MIILQPEKKMAHELNATASFLWNCLEQDSSDETLTQQLCREFEVGLEQAQRDVHQLLTEWQHKGLIEWL